MKISSIIIMSLLIKLNKLIFIFLQKLIFVYSFSNFNHLIFVGLMHINMFYLLSSACSFPIVFEIKKNDKYKGN